MPGDPLLVSPADLARGQSAALGTFRPRSPRIPSGLGRRQSMDRPLLVYTTFPDLDTGLSIGEALVRAKLVACANVWPGMRSVYCWKGAVERAEEAVGLLKTRVGLKEDRGSAAGAAPLRDADHPVHRARRRRRGDPCLAVLRDRSIEPRRLIAERPTARPKASLTRIRDEMRPLSSAARADGPNSLGTNYG